MSTTKGGAFQVAKIVFLRLRFIFLFVVIGVVSWKWELILNTVDKVTRPKKSEDLVQNDFEWYCPMHPAIVRVEDKQKCPICGMPLSRRKKGEPIQLPPGVVAHLQLSPYRIQQAGVATEEIGYRTLVRELRTVGLIDWDERRISRITARVAGRADELAVDFTGVRVRKGDPLYKVYSPDLSATQEEYLLALKSYEQSNGAGGAHGDAADRALRLIDSTRQRLKLWGITDAQILALEKSKKAETYVSIESPASGIVIRKDVAAGQQLMAGDAPYTVVDDSAVWMQAEVFERDLGLVRIGRAVEITAEAYPGESFMGTVSFVAPQVDPATRTVKVRVDVENPRSRLKQGMSVNAVLRLPVGGVGEIYYGCCEACPGVHEDKPGKCVKCAMELVKKGGVRADAAEPDRAQEEKHPGAPDLHDLFPKKAPADGAPKGLYRCDMDGATRDTPGPCPKCRMELTEADRVKGSAAPKGKAEKDEPAPAPAPAKETPSPAPPKAAPPDAAAANPQGAGPRAAPKADAQGPKESVYRCPKDGAVRDTPGPCPTCKMPLEEQHKVPRPPAERTIYVCELHPEEVFDKPGQCFKESCGGMALEPRKIVPGAKLIYVCPVHSDVASDKPGICPKERCGRKLGFKVVSESTRLRETWSCVLHPERSADGKQTCPDCGRDMKHLEVEQVLAVPFEAVVDTGVRKVVFLDKGHGTFDAAEIEVGPRAGEYYPVLKGLAAGDRVVTAGAFLLDAETRLNPAAGVLYFGAGGKAGGEKK